jgi:hypothetical protein
MNYSPRHRKQSRRFLPHQLLVRLSAIFAVLGLALGTSLVAAPAANAGYSEDVTGAWAALDTDDGTGSPYPGTWSTEAIVTPSLASGFDSSTEAHLTWNAGSGTGGWEGEFSPNLGTSLEIADANFPIEEGAVAYFSYELEDGAVAGGGAPRLFVEVDGIYYNTADHGYSYDDFNAKAIDLPAGEVGHVGIVYDNGVAGTVRVSRPVIDGLGLNFPTGDDTDESEANAFGKEVSAYVKENGGPPPHAKANGN